jgi:uncharacterized membrane protein
LPVLAGFETSTASSVGPSGLVVGWASGSGGEHAMVWSGNTVVDLGLLRGTVFSMAGDVNAAGTIVGSSGNHAVEWKNGRILDFGGYGGVRPDSINASGRFVGYGIIANGDVGGPITDAGRSASPLRYLVQSKLGAAQTIGDGGEVVGFDQDSFSSPRIPWRWHFQRFTPLPFLSGTSSCVANGLNGGGVAVGICGAVAVRWSRSGVVDLNTLVQPNSGWQLVVATTINRKGVIVGDGYFGGQFQSFMLVPSPNAIRYSDTHE